MLDEDDLLDPIPPFKDLDYKHQILDEICLEGLDGITLQALWLRMQERPGFHLGFSAESKEFIWDVVKSLKDVKMYKLKAPRNDLIIHDRYKYIDGELGIVVEPESLPEDIYPFSLVDDAENRIRGSCQSYSTRTLIKTNLTLKSAEALGGTLVLVGSQDKRNIAVLGDQFDPLQAQSITAMQWALLERIGRARFLGEVTQGNLSLQFTNENPKTLFYHRKSLLKKGLLTKQVHHQKTKKQLKNQKTRSQNSQGTLFHLPRFYVERQPKTLILVRKTIEYLKNKPQGRAAYEDLKGFLNLGNSFKKLLKAQEFQRFIRGDVKVPYRAVYPDAEESEWKKKGVAEEKMIRAVELIDFDVVPEDVFNQEEGSQEEQRKRCSSSDGRETREGTPGILDQSEWMVDRSMMWQAYKCVEKAGPEGISQQDLGRKLGHGKLEARTICRNLLRRDLVITIMNDQGRQRVTNFVAKKLEHLCPSSNQFLKEKMKNLALTGTKSDESLKRKRPAEESDEAVTAGKRMKTDALVDLSESNSCDSSIFMSISSDFQMDELNKSHIKKKDRSDSQSTYRQLRRANTIIEAVRQHKVIDDPTKLYKMIQENEVREGYTAKMDKKSLMRMLYRLGKDGQIKNIRVQLELDSKTKSLHFVCEPSIDETNTVIQSAIEQAKMKFNSYRLSPEGDRRYSDQPCDEEDRGGRDETPVSRPGSPRQEADSRSGTNTPRGGTPAPSPTKGNKSHRKYGLQPKFVRMRELHILFYYLSRNYTGDTNLDQAKVLKDLENKGCITPQDKRELQYVKFFDSEVSWKMFIPPLPTHLGWSDGWCLMCDVLLRLPMSIFVKLVHVTMDVPGLQEYLAHPVKQHLLIRNLPQAIRNKLLHQRKYIFTIHEVSTRLAYIGVIQFGPQKLKEKDQVFVYINKSASLLDTTGSLPGYHQIEAGKEYPRKNYKLESLADVEHYWYNMWEICINTPLGESSSVSGQEITLEVMDRKPEMLAALAPRLEEEAPRLDLGIIPGDGLGAAGLDSSIFAHLKRNWSWNTGVKKGEKFTKPPFCIKLLQDDREDLPDELSLSSVTLDMSSLIVTKEPNRAKENRKKKVVPSSTQHKKVVIKESTGRPIKIVRVMGKRKTNLERKPYYDEKDKAALRLMRKLRVDWSPREDSFLLLCKAVGSYLCSNSRTQMVQYTSVRDRLHVYFPESCNKTSRACQRRLNYMMKNEATADNVALFLADLQQDEELMAKFPGKSVPNESKADTEARLEREFTEMVDILIKKNRESPDEKAKLVLPGSMEDILKKYEVTHPKDSNTPKNLFPEPRDVDDIHMAVVYTLVVSSLCSATDRKSWAFQLFKIYQQYPDSLLRRVMANLRENKMVSLKKQYSKTKIKQGNYLPLSSSPYQLSVTFSHTFLNRYQYDIYSQSWEMMKVFLQNPDTFKTVVIGQEGGFAAAIISLLTKEKLLFRTEVPDQLVVLDPGLSAVDENYVRILERYKELLRNSDSLDLETVRSPSKVTCTTLFKRKGFNKEGSEESFRHDSSKESSEEPPPPPTTTEPVSSREEVDEMDSTREKRTVGLQNEIVFQEGNETRSNHTVAKSASRIALYMMREEMRETPLDSENPIQHSHDFFVISSCTIQGRLLCEPVSEDDGITKFPNLQVPTKHLLGDIGANENILRRYGNALSGAYQGLKDGERITYVPLEVNIEQEFSTMSQSYGNEDVKKLKTIFYGIDHKKELGMSKSELISITSMSRMEVIRYLGILLDSHVVLEVGIQEARFVTHRNCRDWLIHSYKLNRVRDVEKIERMGCYGSKFYKGHTTEVQDPEPSESVSEESGVSLEGKRSRRIASRRTSREGSLDRDSSKLSDIQSQQEGRMSKEVSEAAQKINWDEMEEVLVKIRPWIRVDGSLNRRVLDRLLGAVLGAVMQQPGSILSTLTARFSPALQPVHARELLFMLKEMQAVTIFRMQRPKQPSLWSKPEIVQLETLDILDRDHELVVEAAPDAIVILGQFIGDKNYSLDFVCHCPCHPERRM